MLKLIYPSLQSNRKIRYQLCILRDNSNVDQKHCNSAIPNTLSCCEPKRLFTAQWSDRKTDSTVFGKDTRDNSTKKLTNAINFVKNSFILS